MGSATGGALLRTACARHQHHQPNCGEYMRVLTGVDIAKYGLLWFKEWHYWIAMTSGGNPQFVAIIYETANIPGQMARARLK
jgi:hypothetical protein